MMRKRERERKVKERDTVSGGEERAQAEEKGEVASAKKEERQQAEVTRRVTGTDVPYVDPPSENPPR
jgi:hypothetical protein